MKRFSIGVFFALTCAAPLIATAQDARTTAVETVVSEAQARKDALEAKEAAELRVERDMVNMSSLVEALAKNLGQLHYLRTLCFGKTDQKWRTYAGDMMTLESGADGDRKRELIRAFNAGYYQEESRHDACAQSVSVDAAALAENGRSLAAMLGDPYRER